MFVHGPEWEGGEAQGQYTHGPECNLLLAMKHHPEPSLGATTKEGLCVCGLLLDIFVIAITRNCFFLMTAPYAQYFFWIFRLILTHLQKKFVHVA